ncbi:hypothetical protein AMTRI_Chr11g95180 [Amborella trichopoda]
MQPFLEIAIKLYTSISIINPSSTLKKFHILWPNSLSCSNWKQFLYYPLHLASQTFETPCTSPFKSPKIFIGDFDALYPPSLFWPNCLSICDLPFKSPKFFIGDFDALYPPTLFGPTVYLYVICLTNGSASSSTLYF